jgi:GTP 3',8-cyclase
MTAVTREPLDTPLRDALGRPLRDLRVSVTDRCNFRCGYCMPKEVFGRDHAFLDRSEVLTFEEIARAVRTFAALGVRKVRLTGGEPLLRRGLETLVAMLARIEGLDVVLTTNGSLLAERAAPLAAAGLRRATVSLDALDDPTFRAMNDVDYPVARVLQGIEAARAAGLSPLKVNAVVRRGVNEHAIVPLVERFADTGVVVRFIEYMDVGTTNRWRMDDVVPAAEIVARIAAAVPVEALPREDPADPAERFRRVDGRGDVGVVASVTRAFCRDCTRARLSADGSLYTCLYASGGTDLKSLLRSGASDDDLSSAISRVWRARTDRYSDLRALGSPAAPKIEMSFIGG